MSAPINTDTTKTRVRFAPSPTGKPHVGAMRTALSNWLLARQTGGTFIVRIEDTDQARFEEGSLESIIEGLLWLGLDWDEGPRVGGPHAPYVQSERLHHYTETAMRLVQTGHAYECNCSPERLNVLRKQQQQRKQAPGYDGKCRYKTDYEKSKAKANGNSVVIRMRVPENRSIQIHDQLRGDIVFNSESLTDFVILKSDGFPTYHLAHIVDDIDMQITHVLRGEEWIASAPKHRLIYDALEAQIPILVHLPILLGRDRSKLSKRHGASSVLDYRDAGYLPEAVVNYLSLLGWSTGNDIEVMNRKELVDRFSLEGLNDSAAIFDVEKLLWMNGVHVRNMPNDKLTEKIVPWLETTLPHHVRRPLDRAYVNQLVPLIRERIKLLSEAPDLLDFFFTDDVSPDLNDLISAKSKMDARSTAAALEASSEVIKSAVSFDTNNIETAFRDLAGRLSLKPGQLFGAVRVAVTGKRVAPPLFDTLICIGRDRCLRRIDTALELLRHRSPS